MNLIVQTLTITAPVFVMLFVGAAIRRLGWIDAAFISTASSLVFRGTMPVLLFLSLLKADLSQLKLELVLYFALATLGAFFLAWAWAIYRCPREDRGVYVQGTFRGNNGIIGLALSSTLYGDYGMSLGGVLAAVAILLYNSLSAMILAFYSTEVKASPRSILLSIAQNPLIIGVLAGVPFAYWQIGLPDWLLVSAESFAHMTLPLALICIGGSLSLNALRAERDLALSATWMKVACLPLITTLGAVLYGFRGADLGVLFLNFASPTAAASFVMAQAIRANYELAAAIIVLTTLAAALTMNIGILVLQAIGWA
ncbi:hypothetical protein LX59_02503 [Azomonas agilis]|uniref:AEC family transporter n=2 Tax=Azomonas agilis TaxID=116849 RepID=A0A562HZW4_9GAMM|nr:hypothetical protein LX59_02503 [Azomonas agilis]